MYKVKTFGEPLRPFKARVELAELDERVNEFLASGTRRVVSVSDTATTDDTGATIGIVRTVLYED